MAAPVELLEIMEDLADGEFKKFKWLLQQPEVLESFPAIAKSQLENADRLDTVDEIIDTYNQNAVDVTIKVMKKLKKNDLVQRLSNIQSVSKETLTDCQRKLKSNLKNKFQHLFDQASKSGKQMTINEIYTELYITEERSGETLPTTSTLQQENTVNIEQFFEPVPGQDRSVRTLLTKGGSGTGKTFLTRKFALDWAEDKVGSSIKLMFPLTFQQLNMLKDKKYTWVGLLHCFFSDLKEVEICTFDKLEVAFILDGLDECQLPLDFHNNEILTDVTDSASVDVLLTNLIMGKLFPSAYLWITTTPKAASKIPSGYTHMVTEMRGFTDLKKEEYLRRRLRNKELASTIISNIKASQSLHIRCHVPVFCFITAIVLEDVLKTSEEGKLPKTMTEMYTHFLVVQSKLAHVRCHGETDTDPWPNTDTSKMILSLGKLAFEKLQKGDYVFHETDLIECGIDIGAVLFYSGMLSQIFKEDKLFSFVHLSFQAFLAALHVIVSFVNYGVNLLSKEQTTREQPVVTEDQSAAKYFFQRAIDESLQSPNGHLDLFLQFLIGLSQQANKSPLQNLLKPPGNRLQSHQDTVQYIKMKIREHPSPEHCISLLKCLNELNDLCVVEEIQRSLSSGWLSTNNLSPAQWSELCFILLTSESELDVFDLKKFSASEEGLLRLLPVIQATSLSRLNGCKLSKRSCEALASVLSSMSSNLRELDLSYNKSIKLGLQELASGLKEPQCRLKTLRLTGCFLACENCRDLSSVLSCQSSSLRELDLAHNNLEDSGVKLLSLGLGSPHCRLETLSLMGCSLTWESCDAVAFFLSCQSSSLVQLDLSMNNLQDSGVLVCSPGLEGLHCKLEILRLSFCNLSEKSCEALASVLTSQSSSLRVLDLSHNNLQDVGVKHLSVGLESPHCNLEALGLEDCKLTEKSCEAVASALSSKSSSLKEVYLGNSQVREEGCAFLASALSSNPSHLKELDLSYNHPGDSGEKLLSAGLEDPRWRLETLKVDHGGVQRLKPGLWKYSCELTLDPNTAQRNLILSENNKQVKPVSEEQSYPYHPERFECFKQVLCQNGLTGRCYWEVEARGIYYIALTYKSISRRGNGRYCLFGANDKSWALCGSKPSVWHNYTETYLRFSAKTPERFAVYLDWPAGTLSFYKVLSDTLTHLHTFYSMFTDPLYVGFGFDNTFIPGVTLSCSHSSMSLCQMNI